MLIKDIPLRRAILDLIDNSIDGANRISVDNDFDGLKVEIKFDGKKFLIEDNCGGISLKTAKEYAFRFGRPNNAPSQNKSVGQFGVGMKRAIFKIGKSFKVISKNNNDFFKIEENVDEWAEDKENWNFEFEILDIKNEERENGTIIEVKNLYPQISAYFEDDEFVKKLFLEIEAAHQYALNHNLMISINGYKLNKTDNELKIADNLKPAYMVQNIPVNGLTINLKLYAGISERDPKLAGWYVYCNHRMILGSDKTHTTGWREGDIKGTSDVGRQYHNDFAYFRGYLYFESDDTSLLPWNTTKTGIDEDNEIYRGVREEMIKYMDPILSFLRNVANEKRIEGENAELNKTITEATLQDISLIEKESKFIFPQKKS